MNGNVTHSDKSQLGPFSNFYLSFIHSHLDSTTLLYLQHHLFLLLRFWQTLNSILRINSIKICNCWAEKSFILHVHIILFYIKSAFTKYKKRNKFKICYFLYNRIVHNNIHKYMYMYLKSVWHFVTTFHFITYIMPQPNKTHIRTAIHESLFICLHTWSK
jgi:hypothetical protein